MLGRTLLVDAAERVTRGWTQGTEAVDRDGNPVEPWDDAAVAWSLLGALVAALGRRTPPGGSVPGTELTGACVALLPYIDEDDLKSWNDAPARTQAEVVFALRGAAADAPDLRPSTN